MLWHVGEWEASLRSSLPPSPERERLLDALRSEVGRLKEALAPLSSYMQLLREGDPRLAAEVKQRPVKWL